MAWFWLSFADPDGVPGDKSLGVAIVEADDFLGAVAVTHLMGINPGGEVAGGEIPEPADRANANRLIPTAEARELAAAGNRRAVH